MRESISAQPLTHGRRFYDVVYDFFILFALLSHDPWD